jgi:hypothetical protein
MQENLGVSTDPVSTVRFRQENGGVDFYIKIGENRWSATYTSPEGAIEGHVSDPVATRWPVLFRPNAVGSPIPDVGVK